MSTLSRLLAGACALGTLYVALNAVLVGHVAIVGVGLLLFGCAAGIVQFGVRERGIAND